MIKKQQEQIGHILGYAGAVGLFVRFVPLLYEQIVKPREINLYFLYLEMIASIFSKPCFIVSLSGPEGKQNSLFYRSIYILNYLN